MVENQRRVATSAQQMFLRRNLAKILIARRADKRQVAMALDHAGHQKLPLPVYRLGGVF